MNLYKWLGVPAVLVLAACSADSSSGADSFGREAYHRHLEKGTNGEFDCTVYEDGGRVVIQMKEELSLYASEMTMLQETVYGDPSSYSVEFGMKGLFATKLEETCQDMSETFAAYGGSATCSDGNVKASTGNLPSVSSEQISQAVASTIAKGVNTCDEQYENAKELFVDLPGEWVTDEYDREPVNSSKEVAQACDVNVENGLLSVVVTYPDKSAHISIRLEDGTFHVTETYDGVDLSVLAGVCSNYRSDPESSNVTCEGNSISYETVLEGASLEDVAVGHKKEVCPALLSGEMSLEDMWEVQ